MTREISLANPGLEREKGEDNSQSRAKRGEDNQVKPDSKNSFIRNLKQH